ncbi:TetR/AcrR family transcriptional regulator [Amycolatopsis arida]|uniref:TetR/AcrR family transcriptional regulator n=1 Tax=Amycolatopsis arida TaxID=587909 RepID=UPI003C7A3ED2
MLVAAREVFATQGSTAATVEQIARTAGLTRQSVYEHFGDKSALFAAVVAEVEELAVDWIGARARDGTEDLRAWARSNFAAMFEFVAEHPAALPVLQEAERAGDPALSRVRARLARLYTEASRRRWAEHGIEPGRTDVALVTMSMAMAEALVNQAWEAEPPPREALIDLLTEFTIGGVQRLREHGADILTRLT